MKVDPKVANRSNRSLFDDDVESEDLFVDAPQKTSRSKLPPVDDIFGDVLKKNSNSKAPVDDIFGDVPLGNLPSDDIFADTPTPVKAEPKKVVKKSSLFDDDDDDIFTVTPNRKKSVSQKAICSATCLFD